MRRAIALILMGAWTGAATGGTLDGCALFLANCAICHQKGATGLSGQFPRLAGRVGVIARHPTGRAYLIDVLTYGMAGQVTVDGTPLFGAMPSFAALPPPKVAAILRYLVGLGGGGRPPTAAQIAAQRAHGGAKSATDVLHERRKLAAAGLIP